VTTEFELDIVEDETVEAELVLEPLLIGTGTYLLSLGLYRKLELNDVIPSEVYDYLDRSFEFQVTGSPPVHNELVHHPGGWALVDGDTRRPLTGSLDESQPASVA
jgi:hypothetical protein